MEGSLERESEDVEGDEDEDQAALLINCSEPRAVTFVQEISSTRLFQRGVSISGEKERCETQCCKYLTIVSLKTLHVSTRNGRV